MQIHADWHTALAAARVGNIEPARAARAIDPSGALPDFFYARCLAEGGDHLDNAIEILRILAEARPANPLVPQVLALALARTGRPENAFAAADIWQHAGLPHATDLLGQVALTLEAQTRPWPAENPGLEIAWPEVLGNREDFDARPAPAPIPEGEAADGTPEASASNPEECDNLTPETATKELGFIGRRLRKWRLRGRVSRIEDFLIAGKAREALESAMESVAQGDENAELHTVAGLAADELGDPARARAHLSRALKLDPELLIARTHLARVYWRSGWFELANALWASLPVEGPYDYGRHYHLALGYDALGRREEAIKAMDVALSDFFYDIRHFYIDQALKRWMAQWGRKSDPNVVAPASSAGPENA